MPVSETAPVLVGVGACQQRIDDPAAALEPVALMVKALEAAGTDAGAPELLKRADSIRVPRGFWEYPDPARWVAEHVHAVSARTVVSEIGVLQSTLLGQAASDIAEGKAGIVLIAGGEAKYRALRAQINGTEAPLSSQPDVEADEVLRPGQEILHPLEIERGAVMPVRQYAMVDNALRADEGLSLDSHRDEIARLWSAMSQVAAANPQAWDRTPASAEAIRNPSASNPMLAFPYTKFHNSQWNVDQAAGLILCSVGTARRAGIPESKWIYPWVNTESNYMLTFSERAQPHRCPGFAIAGQRAFESAGTEPGQIRHRELYSCFPSAVRVQLKELGIDPMATLTETGGMRFAGGPLNNFVLQATVRMAQVLRDDPGELGLVTAVSGVLTKQGVMILGSQAPENDFRFEDVSLETEKANRIVPLESELHGPARVLAYTATYLGDEPHQGILLCENDQGKRTLALCEDRDRVAAMTREEFCQKQVELAGSVLR
ncbi:MAG: acetyl-CoA acetyltransferase [Myxococcota bacterium]|nr:acetyl-CoA acetyltransferase [Myxococcota bacterium]